jgi:hypothetical protein
MVRAKFYTNDMHDFNGTKKCPFYLQITVVQCLPASDVIYC